MIAAIQDSYLTVLVFALCTAFFIVLLWAMLRRPRDRVVAFAAGNGNVTISRKALQDVIARTCESFPEIIRAKVQVTTSGHKLKTRIQLHLRQSARIRDFSERLRHEITTIMTENLGMEDVGTMEFQVAGIAEDKNGKPPETELKTPARETSDDKPD
jgi:hypothetical protein